MTQSNQPDPTGQIPPAPYGQQPYGSPPAPYGGAPLAPTGAPAAGPIGEVRSTGMCVLLTVVTLGFYTWYWYYKTHDEMKRHTGAGLGGGIALLLAILVGIVMPFLTSHEVGELYARRGQAKPVTAITGLWYLLLGWLFLIGALVWFIRTNRALNEYWISQGAQA